MPVMVSADDPSRVLEWACNTFVGRRMVGGLNVDGSAASDREVSSVHAALFWSRRARAWHIQDLGSANGTAVDGTRVPRGESLPLHRGVKVAFGSSQWVVREDEPPSAAATSGGELRVATNDLLLLPDEKSPEVVVIREGAGWQVRPWSRMEAPDGQPIGYGDTVEAGGRTWQISLPGEADLRTARSVGFVADHALHLAVPRRMESIAPTFVRGEHRISLPPRRHHELWWLLAEARLADRAKGRGPEDEGWVETGTLVRQLGLGLGDSGYLNVLVHRSRDQLAKTGFTDFVDIIHRRQSPGTALRLGVRDVVVTRIDR